jgi:hypothetical protein
MLLGKLDEKSKSMKDLVVNVLYRPLTPWNGYNYHHLSITFAGQVTIMILLLTFLICCIGEFDIWPSNIFQFLVCAKPTTTTTVKEVAAFFYENGLPLRYAQYYNMKHKKCMWINVYDQTRMEPVFLEKSNITLGVNGTERANVIREK